MSWIHAEDDILNHLTVAGDAFGVPAWDALMSEEQRAAYRDGRDAAVALRHQDGRPLRRHIVAVEDCVQAFLLSLHRPGIEGQTFMIAMTDPFDYEDAARYAAQRLGIAYSTSSIRWVRTSASTPRAPATSSGISRAMTSGGSSTMPSSSGGPADGGASSPDTGADR